MEFCDGTAKGLHDRDCIAYEDGDCPLCWALHHMRKYRSSLDKAEGEVKELREKLDAAEYHASLAG